MAASRVLICGMAGLYIVEKSCHGYYQLLNIGEV